MIDLSKRSITKLPFIFYQTVAIFDRLFLTKPKSMEDYCE